MLSQIEFKLNVETQYLKGVEKMVQLYGMEGDRKSKADAAARRVESKQKILLLKQALKRYEELHIDIDSVEPDGMLLREVFEYSVTLACLVLMWLLLFRRLDQHAEPAQAPNGSAYDPCHGRQGRRPRHHGQVHAGP